jgi:hypothetical protein
LCGALTSGGDGLLSRPDLRIFFESFANERVQRRRGSVLASARDAPERDRYDKYGTESVHTHLR